MKQTSFSPGSTLRSLSNLLARDQLISFYPPHHSLKSIGEKQKFCEIENCLFTPLYLEVLFTCYLLSTCLLSTCYIIYLRYSIKLLEWIKHGFIISNIYSMGKDELGNIHFPIVHGTSNTLENSFSNSTPDQLRVFPNKK